MPFGRQVRQAGIFSNTPFTTVQVALNTTTWTTLVGSPSENTSRNIIGVWGQNTEGTARILQLSLLNTATRTILWESASTAQDALFVGPAGVEAFNEVGIALTSENHKLQMRVASGASTDTVVCTYITKD